jgi:predicted porin
MQKKLMVVAVAGALVAPALAFAQSSTVQLYGRAVIEYGYVDQGDGKNKTDMLQTPGGSAIGLKGEEKLGGGMSAWFQCESSADIRGENQDGLCTRNSALGFKGGFGNVYIGKWDTPFKKTASIGDGAGSEDTGLLGTAFVLFGSSTGTSTSSAANATAGRAIWKRRQQNSVNYDSPKFGGFGISAAYSTGNSATAGTDTTVSAKPRVMSIAGMYAAGPFKAGLAYEKHDQFGALGAQELNDDAWVASGAYTWNKLTFGGVYSEQKYELGAGNELKKKVWSIGADWDLSGPHSVGANFANADDTKGSGAAPASIGTSANTQYNVLGQTGAKMWQIYYGHAFSKRTTAKVAYVSLDNDSNANYTLGGVKASAVATANKDQNAIVLLVKHNF